MGYTRKRKDRNGKIRYQRTVDIHRSGIRYYRAETFDSLEEADKWERQYLCEIDNGVAAPASKRTVAIAIEAYIAERLKGRKYAWQDERRLQWWKEQIGKTKLSDANQLIFDRCVKLLSNEIGGKGKIRSGGTVLRYIATMSAVLEFCIRDKFWLTLNPLRKIRRPSPGKGRKRTLSEDEIHRILTECLKSKSKHLLPVLILATYTGMRRGEILSLRWKDIHFERKEICLPTSKNGEPRDIPMAPEVLQILSVRAEERRGCNALIFPGIKNPEHPTDIRTAWERVLKLSGVTNATLHTLRHTFSSLCAKLNISSLYASRLTGHTDPRVTEKIYTHTYREPLHEAINKLGDHLAKTKT